MTYDTIRPLEYTSYIKKYCMNIINKIQSANQQSICSFYFTKVFLVI